MASKESKSVVEQTVVDEVNIAALVLVNQKILPQPIPRDIDRRIVFKFPQDITESLTAFWSNTPVPILDYLQALRRIRAMLVSAKAEVGR